mmetsp:Transcript_2930/g.4216  ORF Transcript_2930/g.4216 Transcript_2930/m.4216 type:complete len:116 (-) Transcript_2930:120-467(-)
MLIETNHLGRVQASKTKVMATTVYTSVSFQQQLFATHSIPCPAPTPRLSEERAGVDQPTVTVGFLVPRRSGPRIQVPLCPPQSLGASLPSLYLYPPQGMCVHPSARDPGNAQLRG